MENYRRRYPARQRNPALAHHSKKRASDNNYCDGPVPVKRHRAQADCRQTRRANLGNHTATNVNSRYQQRTSLVEANQESQWSHTRRSDRSTSSTEDSTKDHRESLWSHTRQSEKSNSTDSSHSVSDRRTGSTNPPPSSLSSTLSSSFSYTSYQQPQPFYYTMHPENERVAKQRKKTIDRQSKDGHHSYNTSLHVNTSFSPPKSTSSMYCETSLVSSSAIYDDVFSPNLPRTSTLKSQLSAPSGSSSLRQQPSISTITSRSDSFRSSMRRPRPEGVSSASDGYMDMTQSYKGNKKLGMQDSHSTSSQVSSVGECSWKRSLKPNQGAEKHTGSTSGASFVNEDSWKRSLKPNQGAGKQSEANSLSEDSWKRSLKCNQGARKQAGSIPGASSANKDLWRTSLKRKQGAVKESDVNVQKCKEGHDVATQRGMLHSIYNLP